MRSYSHWQVHKPSFPKRRSQRDTPYHFWTPHYGFAVEVGEHDFMGEERHPLKGGGAISIRAAEELVFPVGQFHQSGLAELADKAAAVAAPPAKGPCSERCAQRGESGGQKAEVGGQRMLWNGVV